MRTEANGIQTHYDLSGKDDAPVVMLGHSLGTSMIMWDAQIEQLQQQYRVLRYDTRGHGNTEAPREAYTLDQLGDDAIALLDGLGIDQIHWVGLSMGGMIGQNLALRYPNRLYSVCLCDTMAQIPVEAQTMWTNRIALAEGEGMMSLVQPLVERWFSATYLKENPASVQAIREQVVKTPVDGFVGCCHAIRELDYLDSLVNIKTPALIVVGEDDPATPVAASQAMNARMPDSRLTVIPDARHLSNIEQARMFNDTLLAFLRSQS